LDIVPAGKYYLYNYGKSSGRNIYIKVGLFAIKGQNQQGQESQEISKRRINQEQTKVNGSTGRYAEMNSQTEITPGWEKVRQR
jgi:hypothetical protein